MQKWGTCAHMCTKYEVCMSNPVPGGLYTNIDDTDAQSMIVLGSLVDKPTEAEMWPKLVGYVFNFDY